MVPQVSQGAQGNTSSLPSRTAKADPKKRLGSGMIFHMVFCRGEMACKMSYLILATFFRHRNVTYRTWFCRHIVSGFVDISNLGGCHRARFGAWGLWGHVGLGAWIWGGWGGYVVWVSWVVAINTMASIFIRCASIFVAWKDHAANDTTCTLVLHSMYRNTSKPAHVYQQLMNTQTRHGHTNDVRAP